ncbi:MAG: carbohydrate-binding protein, partial [Oxalobacteraceae bacterium]
TWGYKVNDHNFKSSASLTRNLIDIASKGGNYLLNVGPDASGIIPAPEVQRLAAMGAWMKKNGDSIYATMASPYKRLAFDGRATVKGKTLYLNVFSWPSDGLMLTGLQTQVKSAKVVATGQNLNVLKANDGTLRISKPSQLDPVSTAIALELTGPPVVAATEPLVQPMPDGSYVLTASDAILKGEAINVEGTGKNANVGYWTNRQDAPQWNINVPARSSARYQMKIEYSCEPGTEGATFEIVVDGTPTGLMGTVAKTAGWYDYQMLTLDKPLTLSPGKHVVQIKPLSNPGFAVMNLRGITLSPTM